MSSTLARERRILPASPQGLVDRNQAGRRLGPSLSQSVLCLEQSPLGIEHLEEIGGSVLVTQPSEARRGPAGAGGCVDVREPFAGAGMRDERVLGLLERQQDGLLVPRQSALGARAARGDAGSHTPEVERGP